MEEFELSLENKLRELRREHRLSQEDLADALGVSRQSIIALEQGRYLPSLPIVVSICRFFDMPFEALLFGDEGEEPEEEKKVNIKVVSGVGEAPRKEKIMPGDMEMWRPLRDGISLRDAMDRLLEDSFITPRAAGAVMPKIDIKERKEDFLVKAEMPGMSEEEVEIEVTSDGIVTISGERKEEKEEKEEGYRYKESYSGTFSRSFTLPAEVIADKAMADMEKGILMLTIPKAKPEKVQKVKIAAKKK